MKVRDRFEPGARLFAWRRGGRAYYQRTHREIVKIDAPGFSGEISKDKGVDIEVGKDANRPE